MNPPIYRGPKFQPDGTPTRDSIGMIPLDELNVMGVASGGSVGSLPLCPCGEFRADGFAGLCRRCTTYAQHGATPIRPVADAEPGFDAPDALIEIGGMTIADPLARIAQASERIADALEKIAGSGGTLTIPPEIVYGRAEQLPVCNHEGFRDSGGVPILCTKTVGHDGLHGWSDLYTWGDEGTAIRTGLSIRRDPPTDPPINCATG